MLAFNTQPPKRSLVTPEPAGTPNLLIEENASVSVYFHGQLQSELGFDVAYLHDGNFELPNPGAVTRTQACLAWNHNTNQWMAATIRLWLSKCNKRYIGFITSPDDPTGEADAIRNQKERPFAV